MAKHLQDDRHPLVRRRRKLAQAHLPTEVRFKSIPNPYLPLLISLAALIVSIGSALFTGAEFFGVRSIVLYLEPKSAAAPGNTRVFTLRAANKDTSILRTHVHLHAYPDRGTVVYQLIGPDPEFSAEPFEELGRHLANVTPENRQDERGCVGDIPLLIEVKYVAKGKIHEAIGFYHLAYEFKRSKKAPLGAISLFHLEFGHQLPSWEGVRGNVMLAEPCDWTDTSKVKRDWSLVR